MKRDRTDVTRFTHVTARKEESQGDDQRGASHDALRFSPRPCYHRRHARIAAPIMSVAFRRESDEEHLEPKFELPIPPGPNLVTARGFEQIRARNQAIEAALEGPLSEDERKSLLRDARYWRQRLVSAELTPPADGDRVAFGTRVTLMRDGQTCTLDLVGHDESEPAANRITFTAPLARALIGGEVGDEVDFEGADEPLLITAIAVVPGSNDPAESSSR